MTDYKDTDEGLRSAYDAIVDYHNSLVQIRFTTVGLVLAGNGFLAAGYFQPGATGTKYLIALLGLLLVIFVFVFVIETRTAQLLKNLALRGEAIEQKLSLNPIYGFFSLMNAQPESPRFKIIRSIISHSFGIRFLYIALGIFWVIIISCSTIAK